MFSFEQAPPSKVNMGKPRKTISEKENITENRNEQVRQIEKSLGSAVINENKIINENQNINENRNEQVRQTHEVNGLRRCPGTCDPDGQNWIFPVLLMDDVPFSSRSP